MPTYEYVCGSCGSRFERRQSIREAPVTACPSCGGGVERVVTGGAGFFVRGAGAGERRPAASGCSFEQNGQTCCGRDQRCGAPPCGDER